MIVGEQVALSTHTGRFPTIEHGTRVNVVGAAYWTA
jgi:hypothetical protein